MTIAAPTTWSEANRQFLTAALAQLRARFEPDHSANNGTPSNGDLFRLAKSMEAPPAIATLQRIFNLSDFERDLVLLCAGVEMDAGFATAVSTRSPDNRPTFGFGLSALSGGHWSALLPDAPLRYWRLVELTSGPSLTGARLHISERVLHFLAGVQCIDGRIADYLTLLRPNDGLLPSHQRIAAAAARACSGDEQHLSQIAQLESSDTLTGLQIAACAAQHLGRGAAALMATDIPTDILESAELARLCEREAALSSLILVLDCSGLELAAPQRAPATARFIEKMLSPVIVVTKETVPLERRAFARFLIKSPTAEERRVIWKAALFDHPVSRNGSLDRIADQFALSSQDISAVSAELREDDRAGGPEAPAILWDLCRERTRSLIDHLAQRISTTAGWDDLVLPQLQRETLRDVAVHVRQRSRVYDQWGFAGKTSRGLGISALFAGPSGTGKTMAAEVLARELQLDLYRIDLSQVVNKYIGETEKNLSRLFEAAEGAGAILLFDEADALFGKRTEVHDSLDRFANIEIGYLLQRMESYAGLAILTTNFKSALDPAFLRRIRFVVQFPFPDASARSEIWRSVFPSETPLEGLEIDKLAKVSMPGGNIRNVAMNAAFAAADADEPVRMAHLLRATRAEFAKLERSLPESDIRGWV